MKGMKEKFTCRLCAVVKIKPDVVIEKWVTFKENREFL